MRIVELSDYSMVVMKDSDDPPWVNLGDYYRETAGNLGCFLVDVGDQITVKYIISKEFVYAAGKLVLYFKDKIPERFHLKDKVKICPGIWEDKNRNKYTENGKLKRNDHR